MFVDLLYRFSAQLPERCPESRVPVHQTLKCSPQSLHVHLGGYAQSVDDVVGRTLRL
jgi:hypothetical protein